MSDVISSLGSLGDGDALSELGAIGVRNLG